jgi:hypothetical protein
MSYAGTSPHDVMLSTVVHYFQTIAAQNAASAAIHSQILERIALLETQVARLAPEASHGDAPGLSHAFNAWKCPVCGTVLEHSPSFKGHIRRLVVRSKRPQCVFNSESIDHQVLVQRFEGATFELRCASFSRSFYGFVRCVISATYDPSESFRLIHLWLQAAKCTDIPFPVCPKSNSDSSGQGSSSGSYSNL